MYAYNLSAELDVDSGVFKFRWVGPSLGGGKFSFPLYFLWPFAHVMITI